MKTTSGPEAELVELVLRSVGILYGSCADVWKNHTDKYGPVGLPDLIGHIQGRFIGWELKANGSYPTRAQAHQIIQLHKKGACSAIILTVPDHFSKNGELLHAGGYFWVPPYALELKDPLNPMLDYKERVGWRRLATAEYPVLGQKPIPYLKLKAVLAEYLE